MKKSLMSLLMLCFLCSCSFADCLLKDKTNSDNSSCESKKEIKCLEEDDDEYYDYNECFFDKQYKKMKKELCLTKKQEACIDKLYKEFKVDMENKHSKYIVEKNKLLEMIECDKECYKNQIETLKNIKKETKERCKEFKQDVKEQLCKSQYSDFRKFQRKQYRKMKKLVKYGKIYKFPCVDCCK